eukprot:3923241-Amphidinium_carterae.2
MRAIAAALKSPHLGAWGSKTQNRSLRCSRLLDRQYSLDEGIAELKHMLSQQTVLDLMQTPSVTRGLGAEPSNTPPWTALHYVGRLLGQDPTSPRLEVAGIMILMLRQEPNVSIRMSNWYLVHGMGMSPS